MKKDVKIYIKSTRRDEGEQLQETEFYTEGKYYLKDGMHYLSYKESEITGFEGSSTTLKTDGETITMVRFGKNNSQFVFEKGRQHIGHYQTQFGSFSTCVTPSEVTIALQADRGLISAEYLLNFAGECSHNFIEVKYEIQG